MAGRIPDDIAVYRDVSMEESKSRTIEPGLLLLAEAGNLQRGASCRDEGRAPATRMS